MHFPYENKDRNVLSEQTLGSKPSFATFYGILPMQDPGQPRCAPTIWCKEVGNPCLTEAVCALKPQNQTCSSYLKNDPADRYFLREADLWIPVRHASSWVSVLWLTLLQEVLPSGKAMQWWWMASHLEDSESWHGPSFILLHLCSLEVATHCLKANARNKLGSLACVLQGCLRGAVFTLWLSGCSEVSCEALSFKKFSGSTLDQAFLCPWAWEGILMPLPSSLLETAW